MAKILKTKQKLHNQNLVRVWNNIHNQQKRKIAYQQENWAKCFVTVSNKEKTCNGVHEFHRNKKST